MDRLTCHREGTRDDRLARDGGGNRGENHQRHQQHRRGAKAEEETSLDRAAGQHEGRLPRIIQHQRRENHTPAQPDRSPAEMAEVGIERLRPGNAKEHAAEHQHDVATTGKQELQAHRRIEGP